MDLSKDEVSFLLQGLNLYMSEQRGFEAERKQMFPGDLDAGSTHRQNRQIAESLKLKIRETYRR